MEVQIKIIMYLLMTIALGYYKIEGREPVLHRVGGGRYAWTPEVNFTKWANNEHFYKGDWLYFGFDKHIYNVLEVNKTNYENCIDKGFINNITRGGRDVFQLLEERSYYFLCGRGFCFKGMRVTINVEAEPSTPALSPTMLDKAFSSISSRKMSPAKLTVIFAIVLACTFM